MGIHYCDFLWGILMGNLMGMSYGAFLSGFLMSSAGLGRLGWAGPGRSRPGRAGLARAGMGWHGMSWACKVQLKIPIRFPHKKSP